MRCRRFLRHGNSDYVAIFGNDDPGTQTGLRRFVRGGKAERLPELAEEIKKRIVRKSLLALIASALKPPDDRSGTLRRYGQLDDDNSGSDLLGDGAKALRALSEQ